MSHIQTIGAGLFTDLAFSPDSADAGLPATPEVITNWMAKFTTEIAIGAASVANDFYRITNVREFPAVGTPANIVNVPSYGQKTSSQVQGQADAPTLEVTLNFVPDDWQKTANYLGSFVGDGVQYYFRFTVLNTEPTGTGATKWASLDSDTGLSTVDNSQYFWVGKLEALSVNPQLTDANQATLTISTQSDFYGAFTNT